MMIQLYCVRNYMKKRNNKRKRENAIEEKFNTQYMAITSQIIKSDTIIHVEREKKYLMAITATKLI